MRRLMVMAGLVTVVLVGAGVRLLSTGPPARASQVLQTAPAGTAALRIPNALRLQLLRYLNGEHARPLPPRPLPIPLVPRLPQGGACAVAAGACSPIPCIEFARAASVSSAAVAAGPSAVVLRLAAPVRVLRGAPQPGRRACDGRLGAPKILRVSAP